MSAPARPQKITLAEMRSSGVRGLLIYCADAADPWPHDEAIGSSCPRVRLSDHAQLAASAAQTCGRILIGISPAR
jgi:hypothetical protein